MLKCPMPWWPAMPAMVEKNGGARRSTVSLLLAHRSRSHSNEESQLTHEGSFIIHPLQLSSFCVSEGWPPPCLPPPTLLTCIIWYLAVRRGHARYLPIVPCSCWRTYVVGISNNHTKHNHGRHRTALPGVPAACPSWSGSKPLSGLLERPFTQQRRWLVDLQKFSSAAGCRHEAHWGLAISK